MNAGTPFLVLGVAGLLVGALGCVRTRDTVARLHFAGVASVAGVPLLVVGLLLGTGLDRSAGKETLVVLLVAGFGPVVSAAIARATTRDRPETTDPNRLVKGAADALPDRARSPAGGNGRHRGRPLA